MLEGGWPFLKHGQTRNDLVPAYPTSASAGFVFSFVRVPVTFSSQRDGIGRGGRGTLLDQPDASAQNPVWQRNGAQ
jgi:hypothetical protein